LHFTDKQSGADRTEENYNYGKYKIYLKFQIGYFQKFSSLQRIWQFVKLVSFKGTVGFRQYISKEQKLSGINYTIYVT
jgi:hypothetical protein